MLKRSYSNYLFIATLILFYILVSLPILQAGFYADDTFFSLTRGMVKLADTSIWTFTSNLNHSWIFNSGRLFPLNLFTQYPFEYLFIHPLPYQCVRIILIGVSLFPVAWFVYLITQNIKNCFFILLIIPAFWSLRDMSDPLTSYGAIFPFLLFCIFLSLCFFLKFNRSMHWNKFVHLSLSILFFILALLTYEIAIASFFAILLLIWLYKTSNKNSFILSALYLFITLCYLGTYHWIKVHATGTPYNGVSPAPFTLKTLLTFLYQLTSPLPLSYGILRGHYFKANVFISAFSQPETVIALILVFIISFYGAKLLLPSLSLDKRQKVCFISLGLIFNIIPAFLIGISEKYQTTMPIHWGDGYLPTYIQYIGIVFIAFGLLSQLRKMYQTILAFSLALITALALIFNQHAAFQFNEWYQQNQRDVLTNSIDHGLLADLPQNSIVITIPHTEWNIAAFYLQYNHIRLTTIPFLTSKMAPQKQPPLYLIDTYNIPYSNIGYVLYARTIVTPDFIVLFNPSLFISAHSDEDREKVLAALKQHFPGFPLRGQQINANLFHLQGEYKIAIATFSKEAK